MIDSKEYSIACVQVLEVLKGLSRNELKKIPKERIELYEKNKDENYRFKLDQTRDYNEQISDVAQAIIANLFVRFVATTEDKKKIYEIEKNAFINEEMEKRKNLNINLLFEKKKIVTENVENEALIIVEKKNLFERIFNKIKNFFKLRK